ncbi:unnamed protein product [Meloidogyne enterolobii]|uniref:Uncharacterized protein n=1 Tax=Meloidogyne enterolobii TaxID=390850 RepID=A0ACB0YS85_MELEN
MIDTKIHSVDRAWPIMNPDLKIEVSSQQQQQQTSGQQQGGGHVVHVNPKFLNGKQPTGVKQENKQQDKQPEKIQEKKKIQPDINANKTVTNQIVKTEEVDPDKNVRQRKIPKKAKENNTNTTNKTTTTTSTKTIKESGVVKSKESTNVKKPESLLSLKLECPPQQPSQQQSSQHKGGGPPTKRPRTTTTAQHISSNVSNKSTQRSVKPQQPRVSKQNVPEPSRALGAHAFNVVMTSQPQPTPSLQPQIPPQQLVQQPLQQPQPTQQQPQIIPPPQLQHQQQFPPPQIPTSSITDQQPQLLMIPQVSTAPPTNLQQPPPFIKEIPPPQITTMTGIPQHNFPPPIPNIQHNIQNVTPRLPGVPENNRIFVDGKAYEVFYLDQIAVIERNGLPHRVSFAGPARNVIIDKTAYCMSFGEPIQVSIDDQLHILRFGGPSRELYMGNFPFKGAFGGPPINATINGRRHEIRLCGPPPEVRIDPEPSYELMRYMPAIRQQQIIPQQKQIPQQPKVEAKKDPVLDVTSLLQRLKNSGILSQLNQVERKNHERQAAIEARNTTLGRSNSPPVPCAHRFEHLERRAMPMAGFDLFSMRSLIIRYDSVIDSIHKQRHCCQDCGIGFKDLYGKAYADHMDKHIEMKSAKSKPRSQTWFMLAAWFKYSEYDEVNTINVAKGDKSQQRQSSPGGTNDLNSKDATSSSQGGQQSTNDNAGGVDADSVENKECCVCHERFEEYWVDDEDVWRLRDSVVVDGKAFHTYCRDDAAAMSSSFATINDDK